jgi:hypothetical protein
MTSDSDEEVTPPKAPRKPRKHPLQDFCDEVWEELQRDKEERERARIERGEPPPPRLPPLTETLPHHRGYWGPWRRR